MTAPLGAPAQKPFSLPFPSVLGFVLSCLQPCDLLSVRRPSASAGAGAAGDLQLEASGELPPHGGVIYSVDRYVSIEIVTPIHAPLGDACACPPPVPA